MVLRDAADTDMEIYRNLELYFEEIKQPTSSCNIYFIKFSFVDPNKIEHFNIWGDRK